jgi:nicotinamide-nucleotide amidase
VTAGADGRAGDHRLEVVAARCLEDLRRARQTLATAESLTAGLVCATLAAVPGASDVLRGGLAAYATDVKSSVLGVDPAVIATHGAVSSECAAEMALRAVELFGADWAVSATGVAGPDPQEGKPPGTVFIAVAGPRDVDVQRLSLSGTRDEIRRASVLEVLSRLASTVERPPTPAGSGDDG